MDAEQTLTPSPLLEALASIDRKHVAKTIDAGAWQSTSVEQVREVANDALDGTGLSFSLPRATVQELESGKMKFRVEGSLNYGPSGERESVYCEVIESPGGRQPLVQQCGSMYSYAAKFAIVGALNLPRGGDDSAEFAHQEKAENRTRSSAPKISKKAAPKKAATPKKKTGPVSGASEERQTPPATGSASSGDFYGDPGPAGTLRGRDSFIIVDHKMIAKDKKKPDGWQLWVITTSSGAEIKTFCKDTIKLVDEAVQEPNNGEVIISWTRNTERPDENWPAGQPFVHQHWKDGDYVIEGVSANDFDKIEIAPRESLADQMMADLVAAEEVDA
tara:strand:- start:12468 stop:13463 length:996 start_codon:yes stop_codon:yes gene_type:complete